MSTHSLHILSRLSSVVPATLVDLAEAWGEDQLPATPRPSASVVLLRDTSSGLETYLLHRHSRMPFAASMVVFPGGRVDACDADRGQDVILACAVRETEEETGVRLEPGALWGWAHWTTPAFEPRRYDTHFYVATMPDDQQANDISGETDSAAWTRPADALVAAERREIALMPPTLSILLEMAELDSLAAVRSAALNRVIEPVLPELIKVDGVWSFRFSPMVEPPSASVEPLSASVEPVETNSLGASDWTGPQR